VFKGPDISVKISTCRDGVVVWWATRTFPVIDRVAFREWLLHLREPLAGGSPRWAGEQGVTRLTIFTTPGSAVPTDTVQHLMEVI
jgi:hypothetical protein